MREKLAYCADAPSRVRWWVLAASIPLPTLICTVYLTFSRWPVRRFTAFSDWAALACSVAVGVVLLTRSNLSKRAVIQLSAIYAFVQLCWLFAFGLEFVCRMFGDCL